MTILFVPYFVQVTLTLFKLNCDKSKELFINFTRSRVEPLPAIRTIQGCTIKFELSVELSVKQGFTINNKLITWNNHIEEVIRKALRRLHFLVQLVS